MTLSDSNGTLFCETGFEESDISSIEKLKEAKGRLSEFDFWNSGRMQYFDGMRPWQIGQYDVALPCATQNELEHGDASALVRNGILAVAEGMCLFSYPFDF